MEFRNHPPRRLFLERERAAFEAALETVRQAFGREYPLQLGNDEVRTADVLAVPNPSHRESGPIGRVHLAGIAEVERALDLATAAQADWAAAPVAERARILRRAAALMAERQDVIAAWEVHEAAKAWGEALADVDEAIDYLTYYAEAAEFLAGEWAAYRPRGVVAVIPPWNFPAAIPTGMTSAALVCGNTVILKPAEQTPIIAYHVVRALHEAGVPADACIWLPGRGEVAGAALVESPAVDMIAFTGSAAVGAAIYRTGSRIRPARGSLRATLAEMGGKNAVLVFPDADLDEAVVAILRSAFGHANQKCSAASRVLIHRAIYPRLRERLIQGAASLPVGPADAPGTVVTPLIDEEARRRVLAAAQRAATEGRVLLEGRPPAEPSTAIPPTLVEVPADAAATASVTQQEIFGPVLALVPFRDEPEALALANGTPYALTAGIFSRSPATIAAVTDAIDAGNVYVNRPTTGARVGVEPFGGHKLSGTGPKAGSLEYLWAFLTERGPLRSGEPVAFGAGRPAQPPQPWRARPQARVRVLEAALRALQAEFERPRPELASDESASTIESLAALLARASEIARPEPTIDLPGQRTHVRWDTPRGAGIVYTTAGAQRRSLCCLAWAALLAGNGVVLVGSAGDRPWAEALLRALRAAGVPSDAAQIAPKDIDLAALAADPAVTFAATDAGLRETQQLYQLLADASATPESLWLKALIPISDGPGIDQAGFLRRFALSKTVAIRTLHLGAELELPEITGE